MICWVFFIFNAYALEKYVISHKSILHNKVVSLTAEMHFRSRCKHMMYRALYIYIYLIQLIYVLLRNLKHVIYSSIIVISYVFVSLLRPGQIVLNTISCYNDKWCYNIDGMILPILLNISYQYWN